MPAETQKARKRQQVQMFLDDMYRKIKTSLLLAHRGTAAGFKASDRMAFAPQILSAADIAAAMPNRPENPACTAQEGMLSPRRVPNADIQVVIMGGFALMHEFAAELSLLQGMQDQLEASPDAKSSGSSYSLTAQKLGSLLTQVATGDIDLKFIIRNVADEAASACGCLADSFSQGVYSVTNERKTQATFMADYRASNYIWAIFAGQSLDISIHVTNFKCIDTFARYALVSPLDVNAIYARDEFYASRELTKFNALHMFVLVLLYLLGGAKNNRVVKGAKLIGRCLIVSARDGLSNARVAAAFGIMSEYTGFLQKAGFIRDKNGVPVGKVKDVRQLDGNKRDLAQRTYAFLVDEPQTVDMLYFAMAEEGVARPNLPARLKTRRGGAAAPSSRTQLRIPSRTLSRPPSRTLSRPPSRSQSGAPSSLSLLDCMGYLHSISSQSSQIIEQEQDAQLQDVLRYLAELFILRPQADPALSAAMPKPAVKTQTQTLTQTQSVKPAYARTGVTRPF